MTVLENCFVNRCVFLLARKRYDQVEHAAAERLARRSRDRAALYVLALASYYKGDLYATHSKFVELLQSTRVDRRSEAWFVRQLLSHPLYREKQYDLVLVRATEILPLVKTRRAKVETLRHLCLAAYGANRPREVMEACQQLAAMGYRDKHTAEMEGAARRTLGDGVAGN
jgi:hypothetical protein